MNDQIMNDYLMLPMAMEVRGFALQAALSGLSVCVLVLVAARLLRRRSEPLRYGILLAGVVVLLAVPALVGIGRSVPVPALWAGAEPAEEIVRIPSALLPDLLEGSLADDEPGPSAASAAPASASMVVPTVGAALVLLWALGTGVGLCRLARAAWKQRRGIAGRPWPAGVSSDSVGGDELKTRLARKLGLRRFPDVVLSPAAPMPMVMGLWRPIIVLPESAPARWSPAQWEAILLHEAAHIARRDPWAALVQRVAVILFWWCPPAHLVSRRLSALRENICDDFALEGSCDRVAYAELLLESAERLLSLKNMSLKTVPAALGLLASARGGLEARITRLLEKERRPMTKLSLPGRLAGGGFLALACLLTTAATAFSGGQAAPEKKVQIKIIVDGKEIDLNDLPLGRAVEAPRAVEVVPRTVEAHPSPPTLRSTAVRFVPMTGTAKTGEFLVQVAPTQTAKVDPRIEELVKQAEAIKPGSGAAIRRALVGEAKPGEPVPVRVNVDAKALAERVIRVPMTVDSSVRMVRAAEPKAGAGKKIIVLSVEDGKVLHLQLDEQDLKKMLDKGGRLEWTTPKKEEVRGRALGVEVVKPAPPLAVTDIEALRRQLERLTVEMQDLRRRLEGAKK